MELWILPEPNPNPSVYKKKPEKIKIPERNSISIPIMYQNIIGYYWVPKIIIYKYLI